MNAITTDPVTRAAYKAHLLSTMPTTIGSAEVAELVGAHPQTIQSLNRLGKLPFHNVSLSQRAIKFLSVDVINWMFEQGLGAAKTADTPKRRGRPVGSKNKAQPQA